MSGRARAIGLGTALLALAALRVATVSTTAFNWDEFVLLQDVAHTAQEGRLYTGGHPGLPQAALLPLVEGCRDEIAVGRWARIVWLVLTWAYLAGVFVLLREMLPADRHRLHDAALGTALLGLLPVFLEWSIQVRTDQIALAGGVWGVVALLASRRRTWLALAAGLAFGVGWLGTQKLAYVAALGGLLAAGDLYVRSEWRIRRELARVAGCALGAAIVVLAWRGAVLALFEVPPGHPAVHGAGPEALRNYLDVFDFYRATIGYSQYRAQLPTLGPHLALVACMLAATFSSAAARTRRLALAWAVLGLGIAVGAFHAAAFAYFLMTLGLFAATALTLALPSLRDAAAPRWPSAAKLAMPVLWAALILSAGLHGISSLRDTQAVQRESLRFVHRNFALDRAGFHPEVGLFCGVRQPIGVWLSRRIYEAFGVSQRQREREVDQLLARFRSEPVHYLVQSFRLNQFPTPVRRFWDEHYQPYRDAVFVAGRRLRGDNGETADFELLVDGPYRWLPLGGPHPIRIDGKPVAPGGVVLLSGAPHAASFETDGARGVLVLALSEPPGPAPLPFYKMY